jgi:hypothetical protein
MRDLTPVPDLVQGTGLIGAARARRPVYVDLLPFRILERTEPEAGARLAELAQQEVRQRWTAYEEMAARGPEWFPAADGSA